MELLHYKTVKAAARERLSRSGCPYKKRTLLYAGVAVGAVLLASLLQFYLGTQVANTGGLSGLGTRSVLQTVQMVLQYGVNIALPFWQMGFLFLSLRLARGENAQAQDLLQGFRRFGPVLRLLLLEGALYLLGLMACLYAGSFLFALTPLSYEMNQLMLPLIEAGSSMEAIQEQLLAMPADRLSDMLLPYFIITGVLFAAVAVWLFYRFRMARYVILEQPGGLLALVISSKLTKGHRWQLFKLDLSFWWYYGLMALATAVLYADVLLKYIVLDPAVSADAAWIGSCVAGAAVQLVILWQAGGYVQTAYAAAYEHMKENPVQPKTQPVPQKLPWDDYQ